MKVKNSNNNDEEENDKKHLEGKKFKMNGRRKKLKKAVNNYILD